MFNDDSNTRFANMNSRPGEYRRYEKTLPFSVKIIGGPDVISKHRIKQAHKEQLDSAKAKQRYEARRARAINVLTQPIKISTPLTIKTPWYTKTYNWLLNTFLSVKFE